MNLTPLQLNYSNLPESDVARLSRQYGSGYKVAKRHPAGGELSRIGYIGGDFRRHSCMLFFPPIVERSRFESFVYMTDPRYDATTDRIASGSHFAEVCGMTGEQIAERVRGDEVDILIDLAGYTYGNGLDALAEGAAPIQCTYLGYPNTLGNNLADARIVDSVTDLIDEDQFYSEKLIRKPGCFLTFDPPEPVEIESRKGEPVTFGSFANYCKLNYNLLDLWAQILKQAPGARLVLKSSKEHTGGPHDRIRTELEQRGIESGRIEFIPPVTEHADHLATYNRVDVQLDTYPYNGTATTCESLWMGVPVVTLAGKHHRSRVGKSLLGAAGHRELVAHDVAEYVQLAITIAKLSRHMYRPHLRKGLLKSELCDHARFVSDFDDTLQRIWEGMT